jgi:hypothetical protein
MMMNGRSHVLARLQASLRGGGGGCFLRLVPGRVVLQWLLSLPTTGWLSLGAALMQDLAEACCCRAVTI